MSIRDNEGKKGGRALSQVLILIGGTGASQVVTALSAPLLTRLYAPHDFGVYAISLAVLNVLLTVVSLRYELAIVLARSARAAANVMTLCALLTVVTTVLSLVLCALSWLLPSLYGYHGLEWWAVVMIPGGILFGGGQQLLRFWFVRARQFHAITQMVMVQTMVTIGTQLLAGVLGAATAQFLMLGTVLGYAFMVATALPAAYKTFPASLLAAVRRSRLIATAKRHRRFPMFSAPYYFLNQAAARVLLLILAAFVSTATIGEFALAQRVVYLPVTVLTMSISQVFYGRAVDQLDDPRLHRFVFRIIAAGLLLFVPLIALNFAYSRQLFMFAFGARWAEAGNFAAYLGIASGVVTLTVWLDRIFDIRGRQLLALGLEACNDAVCLSVLALLMYFTRNTEIGVAGFALATAGFYITWTFVAFRIAPFPLKYFRSIVVVGTAATLFGVIVWTGISCLTDNLVWRGICFLLINSPLLAAGIWVGRNGLKQRATKLGFLEI